MRLSLGVKLILAFLMTTLATLALVGVMARLLTSSEFDRFLRESSESDFVILATHYYERNNSWQGVDDFLHENAHAIATGPGALQSNEPQSGNRQPPPGGPDQPPPFVLLGANNAVLTRNSNYALNSIVPASVAAGGMAISVSNVRVGTVIVLSDVIARDPIARQFIDRTDRTLLYAIIGGCIIALLVGILQARLLMRPILALTKALHNMQRGELQQVVDVRSRDEIGELVAAFNQMSADLARANTARRQMTADIAHDLRTPLTVITGYLESMYTGVLQPTPTRFKTMYDEAERLQRLVEDLRLLSLFDAGELRLYKQNIRPSELLDVIGAAFGDRARDKGVALETSAPPSLPNIFIDRDRLVQVLGNLMSNALHYTPSGGKIAVSAYAENGTVKLAVTDTGCGIAAEKLPYIFDRLYRADTKSRDDGGSGLGLAIAKAIVDAHQGKISAQSTVGIGTTIEIRLPAQ
jgi:signal transduction histidine kinase